MSALPLGRYRELLSQLLQLNEQTAALRRELGACSWAPAQLATDGPGSPPDRADRPAPAQFDGAMTTDAWNGSGESGPESGSEAGPEASPEAGSDAGPGRVARRPHFLDADYRPRADCLPRPHFLEQAPSPEDEQRVPSLPGSGGLGAPGADPWRSRDTCSVKSFSSAGSAPEPDADAARPDCYSLLSLLSLPGGAAGGADVSECLLQMSRSADSCAAMRRSGCIPLLVQLVHSRHAREARDRAARALRNLVHAQADDRAGRREARVLRLLEHARDYRELLAEDATAAADDSRHPAQSVAALMKLSFDEEHRLVVCRLGGLQALAALVAADQAAHGSRARGAACLTTRKYAGMALTNLTFGDGDNKALLCSCREFMAALVAQLEAPGDDLRQVTAAVLRNLSWRADASSKAALRGAGAVAGLARAALAGRREAALKSVLSALWNLTAHCSLNKAELCAQPGALAFLADALSCGTPAIVENAGGILRNVSSHVAVREDYREILRERGCLRVLLQQLKSPSLTVVSNSCGTLWNLSARCRRDQRFLWDHGAVPMLRSLVHSKHKMIAMGSSAALKNLLNSEPARARVAPETGGGVPALTALPTLPTLGARKQRALEQDIDQSLAETCENIEPATSPAAGHRDEKLLLSAAERHLALSLEQRRLSAGNRGFCVRPPVSRPTTGDYSDLDENDACDQPVDYSRKYSETKGSSGAPTATPPVARAAPSSCGDYRETDLDQPTDYSLRYAEDRSDAASELSEAGASSVHEDTVKHFCTEGTPYETPINFSTANSITDLRPVGVAQPCLDDSTAEGDQAAIESSTNIGGDTTVKCSTELMTRSDEKDTCSSEDVPKPDNDLALCVVPVPGSKFSSGMASPEKPIQYCEEGTPGYFSRVSSLSSLEEARADWEPARPRIAPSPPVAASVPPDYAEETPLMFSRCSSLGSLSGCSVPDRPDDVGSVLSDFSRMTSGCLSPSELPDSPGPPRQQAPHREEQPSPATSLSALTVDDEPIAPKGLQRCTGVGCSGPEPGSPSGSPGSPERPRLLTNCIRQGVQSKLQPRAPASVPSAPPAVSPSTLAGHSSGFTLESTACGDAYQTYCTEDTPALLSKGGSVSDLSLLSLPEPRRDFSDDSSNISGESDNLLAECIRSGMPKKIHGGYEAQRRGPAGREGPLRLPRPPQVADEMSRYAVEDSPFQPSPSSSLSDLTVHSSGSRARLHKGELSPLPAASPTGSLSSVSLGSDDGRLLDMAIRAGVPQPQGISTERRDSLSSLSSDGELLEQCIASGLPRPRARHRPALLQEAIAEGMPRRRTEDQLCPAPAQRLYHSNLSTPSPHPGEHSVSSKNVLETSVAPVTASDVNPAVKIGNTADGELLNGHPSLGINGGFEHHTILQDSSHSKLDEIDRDPPSEPTDVPETNDFTENVILFFGSKTVSKSVTLCSSLKYSNQKDADSTTTDSVTTQRDKQTNDTWNDNTCPNDLSYPSVSGSAPLLASFCSREDDLPQEAPPQESLAAEFGGMSLDSAHNTHQVTLLESTHTSLTNDDSSSKFTSMSNSTMIENEAARLALAIDDVSVTGRSLDLEAMRPSGPTLLWEEHRKRATPANLLARRALGLPTRGSSEALDANVSCLDSVKPPSEMDDVLDMENSMISVASIMSEEADMQQERIPFPFDLKQPVDSLRLSRLPATLDLDNINPPSLFDELTESTLENDYGDDDNCPTHTLDGCPELPPEAETPPGSDFGSAESTPKKVRSSNKKYLTPKQKRQIARDRYKTYTIAAEMAIKEEENRKKIVDLSSSEPSTPQVLNKPTPLEEGDRRPRPNPKQRRLEDRARYQTQTVNMSLVDEVVHTELATENIKDPELEALRRRLDAKKSIRQKRLENADRYKTRNLDDTSLTYPALVKKSGIPQPGGSTGGGLTTHRHLQLAVEASRARELLRLQEEALADLDCETISLVSNEDDSELNSARMRTFTKSFRNYLPVIESPTAVDRCIEKNLKNIHRNSVSTLPLFNDTLKIEDVQCISGDLTSLECDQNSGTESADQNQNSDSEVEVPQPKTKPTIVKPQDRDRSLDSNGSGENEENAPKTGIRGRRKALYVSPYKKNNIPGKKSPSRTTLSAKATKTNNSKGMISTSRTTPAKAPVPLCKPSRLPNGIIKSKPPCAEPPRPLVRQGTFTKEEPVIIATPAKPLRPGLASPSRLPQPGRVVIKTPSKGTKPSMKNSSSNQSLQSNDSGKTVILGSKASSSAIPKIPTKDVTSKIANLWKKVEQSKKLPGKPDTRVWIAGEPVQSKLVRSSTFEGPPTPCTSTPTPPKQKSSIAIRVSQGPSTRCSRVPVVRAASAGTAPLKRGKT